MMGKLELHVEYCVSVGLYFRNNEFVPIINRVK